MNKIIYLVKIQIKNSVFFERFSKKNVAFMILLLIFASLLLVLFAAGDHIMEIYNHAIKLGLEEQLLSQVFMIMISFSLIFGSAHIFTLFYFSKDIEILLPLPLKPIHILSSRMLIILAGQYVFYLIGMSASMILYGVKHQPDFLFYLNGLLLFLILPIPPLVLISLFCFFIMRFVNMSKYKGLVHITASVMMLISPVLVRKLLNSHALMEKHPFSSDALYLIRNSFFRYQNPIYSFSIIGICFIFVLLFIIAGETLYFKGIVGISESTIKKKHTVLRNPKTLKPAHAYIINEIRSYIKTPVLLINCIIKNSLWPAIILAILGSQFPPFVELVPVLQGVEDTYTARAVYVVAAVIYLQVGQNYPAAIAFSKDGLRLMNCKFIPIRFIDQIMYRVYASAILLAVPSILLLVIVILVFKLSLVISFFAVSILILCSLSGAMLGIITDLNHPKLYWDSEALLVKNNWNLLITNLYAVCMFILVMSFSFIENTSWITAILLCMGGTLAINFGLYTHIRTVGQQKFEAMLDS